MELLVGSFNLLMENQLFLQLLVFLFDGHQAVKHRLAWVDSLIKAIVQAPPESTGIIQTGTNYITNSYI